MLDILAEWFRVVRLLGDQARRQGTLAYENLAGWLSGRWPGRIWAGQRPTPWVTLLGVAPRHRPSPPTVARRRPAWYSPLLHIPGGCLVSKRRERWSCPHDPHCAGIRALQPGARGPVAPIVSSAQCPQPPLARGDLVGQHSYPRDWCATLRVRPMEAVSKRRLGGPWGPGRAEDGESQGPHGGRRQPDLGGVRRHRPGAVPRQVQLRRSNGALPRPRREALRLQGHRRGSRRQIARTHGSTGSGLQRRGGNRRPSAQETRLQRCGRATEPQPAMGHRGDHPCS